MSAVEKLLVDLHQIWVQKFFVVIDWSYFAFEHIWLPFWPNYVVTLENLLADSHGFWFAMLSRSPIKVVKADFKSKPIFLPIFLNSWVVELSGQFSLILTWMSFQDYLWKYQSEIWECIVGFLWNLPHCFSMLLIRTTKSE